MEQLKDIITTELQRGGIERYNALNISKVFSTEIAGKTMVSLLLSTKFYSGVITICIEVPKCFFVVNTVGDECESNYVASNNLLGYIERIGLSEKGHRAPKHEPLPHAA